MVRNTIALIFCLVLVTFGHAQVTLPQAYVSYPSFATRTLGPASGNFYQCTSGDACFAALNQAICDWVHDGVDDTWLLQVQHGDNGAKIQTGGLHTCTQPGSVAAQSITLLPKIINGHLATGYFVVDSDTPLPAGVTVCSHNTDDTGVRQPPDGDINTWWIGSNQGCDNDRPSMWVLEGNWPHPGNYGMLIQGGPWDSVTNFGPANYTFKNVEFRPINTNTAQTALVRLQSPNVTAVSTIQFASNIHFENVYFHSNGTDWCSKVGGITQYWYGARGGTYANGDTGVVNGGNNDATYVINSTSGGSVVIATMTNQGSAYPIANGLTTTATKGSGTGLTFNVLGTAAASPSCVTSFNTGGPSTTNVVTGIELGDCNNCSVEHSYGAYFGHAGGSETHGIAIARGAGPVAILDNWIEGASIPIFTGGEAFQDPLLSLNDVEIRGNHLSEPPSLVGTYYLGPSLLWKAGLELKVGNRVLVDGNTIENIDESGTQNGEGLELNPRGCSAGNQCDNPQATLQNITVTNNVIRHVLTGFDIAGRSGYPSNGGGVTPALRFVDIHNNLIYHQGNSWYFDHFNGLPHPYSVRLSNIGEAFICGGTKSGITITLGCTQGPPGLSQTQIVPGDYFQIAGCSDPTWDMPGVINGFNAGPIALAGTVPNGLTVVYNNPSANSSSATNCVVFNSIGSPNSLSFTHNTLVMDTAMGNQGFIYDGVPTSMYSDLGCGGGPTHSTSVTGLTRNGLGLVTASVSSLAGWPTLAGGNQIIVEVSGMTPADLNGKFYYGGTSGGNVTWYQAGATETGTAFGAVAQMGTCQGVNDFAQNNVFKNNLVAVNLNTSASCPTAGTGWQGWMAQGGSNSEGCKNGFGANGCSELTLDPVTSSATYTDFPGRCGGQYTELGGPNSGAHPPKTLTFPASTVCPGPVADSTCVGMKTMMNGAPFDGNDSNFLNYVLDPSSVYHNAADDGTDYGANPVNIEAAIEAPVYQH